jgi:hypothetical protein
MGLVVCKFPKAGLGNQLFPIMKALVFAHINNLPFVAVNYHQVKLGPYLRGEKSKRKYSGYFNFEKGFLGESLDKFRFAFYRQIIEEPELDLLKDSTTCYRFQKMPHWKDFFAQLKDHRDLVVQLFWKALNEDVLQRVNSLPAPVVGVHVRMGDFYKLQSGQDFSKVGGTRTPEQYFVDTIEGVRRMHGTCMPVSIFTDGFVHEFERLFKMENVHLVEGNNDIEDMIQLSKSRVIIASAASTFGYWSGFLSNAPLIKHPDHIHESIRPASMANEVFEGKFDESNRVLIANIRAI